MEKANSYPNGKSKFLSNHINPVKERFLEKLSLTGSNILRYYYDGKSKFLSKIL